MPINLIDPTVQPVGAGIPNSPLAGMFGKAVGAYGSTFPTAMDRAHINYYNTEAAKIQQQMGASGQLANIFTSALNPQQVPDPNAPPVEASRPAPQDFGNVGPQPSQPAMRMPTPDESIRANMPQLVSAMQAGGHIENTPQIARMMAAYLPGAATDIERAPIGHPSNMDMAMLGSGESYESTPGGMREKNQAGFTAEQKNRTNKIASIQASQGVDYPTAEGLTDGILDLTTDQAGNRVLVNKATGASKLLYSMASGPSSDGRGGAPAPAPAATGVAPVAGQPGAGASNFDNAVGFVMSKEGGFVSNDSGKGPTNFGINQESNPDIDVTKLTPDSAKALYQSRYWNAIGGDKLPPALATVALDAAVNQGVGPARAMLAASGGDPMRMLQLRAQAYQNIAANNPAKAQYLQGWLNRLNDLKTQIAPPTAAGPTGAAPVTAAPAITPSSFKMQAGDLDLPFDTMYGGLAVAGRAAHTASAFLGGEDSDPALAAFGKLNTLKNGLVNAMSVMPGRASNEGMQKRLLEQFPETDSNLLEMQNGVQQGGINPIDAETKFNQGVEQGAALYEQATEALKNPMLDAKTRDAYQTVKSTIQKTFLQTLPGGKYAEFIKSVGEAPPSGQPAAPSPGASNLDTLTAATTMPTYESVPGKPVVSAADIAETAKAMSMTNQQVVDKLREQGRVK